LAIGGQGDFQPVVRGGQHTHAVRQLRRGFARRVGETDPVQHVVRVDMQAPGAVARQRQRRARRVDLEQAAFLLGESARERLWWCRGNQADCGNDGEQAMQVHERTLRQMRVRDDSNASPASRGENVHMAVSLCGQCGPLAERPARERCARRVRRGSLEDAWKVKASPLRHRS